MKQHVISGVLATTILIWGASLSLAIDKSGEGTDAKTGFSHPQGAKAPVKNEAKHKSAPASNPIDVNSASKEELKKLPGIGDAEAQKIIAGRPYCSKTWLVSDKIIPEGVYAAIRSRIEVKLPQFKSNEEIKAYCKKK